MALRALSRVGSVSRIVPQLSTASTRGFANFDERERGEEVLHIVTVVCAGHVLLAPWVTHPDV